MRLIQLMEMPSSPSRVLQYIKNERPFFAISAMHKTQDDQTNKEMDRDLRDMLKSDSSIGFFRQEGDYDFFRETSYIVSSNKLSMDELLAKGLKLGKSFDQDSILFFDGDSAKFHYQDGHVEDYDLSAFGGGGDDTNFSIHKGQKYTLTNPDPKDRNRTGKTDREPTRDFDGPVWSRSVDRSNRG